MTNITNILKCDKCSGLESDYGLEFYVSTRNNPCKIIYCVFCRYTEKKCHICKTDLKSHGMKTRFALAYEKSLMEEEMSLQKQVRIRSDVEKKWARLKSEIVDPIDFSQYLELIEDAVQTKQSEDEYRGAQINRMLEELDESNHKKRLVNFGQETQINRPLPKQIYPMAAKNPKQNVNRYTNQEHQYYTTKFMRYILT